MKSQKIVLLGGIITTILLLIYFSIVGDASNFFQLIGSEPWLIFLVIDFYILIAVISYFVFKKEKTKINATLWTLTFIITGGLGVLLYLFCKK